MNTKDTFIVKGLGGKKTLNGTVEINGAKNAVLKAMAAAILFDGPVILENVPNTEDVKTMMEILSKLGANIGQQKSEIGSQKSEVRNANPTSDSRSPNSEVRLPIVIDASKLHSTNIDTVLAQSMRASVVLTGPLLARYGEVSFPAPGGCVIGSRPIDLFIKGYEEMGAKTELKDCLYHIKTSVGFNTERISNKKRSVNNLIDPSNRGVLKGTEIFFDLQSVGGTETLMMAAVLAKGKTVLKNCAMEPEIVSVAEWLNSCGADIKGAGTTTIEIHGTGGRLLKAKTLYKTIPDRIEAGSFLILGALCAEDLTIKNCEPRHLEAVINLLRSSGVDIDNSFDSIRVRNKKAGTSFRSFNVRTHEYPGFPTDLQAQIVTFLTQTEGEGIVFETIFEGRFKYAEDLLKMGANITVMNPREVLVKGQTKLRQIPEEEELRAHDIRAGFAIVIAALLAKGDSKITNIHLIDRGYENLEIRLNKIGAQIKRLSS